MTVSDRSHLRGLPELVRELKRVIRRRREELRMTQEDVATRQGLSQSTYAAWELDTVRGDTLLSSVFRAAHVLEMDVEIRLVPRTPTVRPLAGPLECDGPPPHMLDPEW